MTKTSRINAIPAPEAPVFPLGAPAAPGFLGIVMLDTRFPRPEGDIGNPASFAVPTKRVVVHGAWPAKVVQTAASMRAARLLEPFATMMRHLERDGAAAITTSCGFLVLLQRELQAAVQVPVFTSSLCMLPRLLQTRAQVGVLTISAARLEREHLRCAGVPRERLADVLVQGVDPNGAFASAILGNQPEMDLSQAQADVLAAALALKQRAPHLDTLVLECTNMPPYAQAIRAATGMRVLSLLDCEELLKPFGPAAARVA